MITYQPKDMNVVVRGATRPPIEQDGYGLVTLEVTVPLYIWTEILTHRRFSRNASSARAMSTKRYAEMGYYLPPVWYTQGNGMQSGKPITKEAYRTVCEEEYAAIMQATTHAAQKLAYLAPDMSVSKEQANRLIPPIKMVRGIITGTEAAWMAFRRLRKNNAADVAMERFAEMVDYTIMHCVWERKEIHTPYDSESEEERIARIARVSYDRTSGKNDHALYQTLLDDQHLSPFEHRAEWVLHPPLSNFSCRPDDVLFLTQTGQVWHRESYYGWKQQRSDVDLAPMHPCYVGE